MLWDTQRRIPVAFHDERRVIDTFKVNYELSNPEEKLIRVKLKKNQLDNYPEYSDLYLVRYGESFVQSKYLYIAQLDSDQIVYDYQYAKDMLNHIAEFIKDDKKRKVLAKASSIVEDELIKIQRDIPSVHEYEQRHEECERYRNHICNERW